MKLKTHFNILHFFVFILSLLFFLFFFFFGLSRQNHTIAGFMRMEVAFPFGLIRHHTYRPICEKKRRQQVNFFRYLAWGSRGIKDPFVELNDCRKFRSLNISFEKNKIEIFITNPRTKILSFRSGKNSQWFSSRFKKHTGFVQSWQSHLNLSVLYQ